MARPLVTFHVDTERGWRGGEQQMAYLVKGLVARGHRAAMVLQPDGEAFARMSGRGLEVFPIPMRGEVDPLAVLRLARGFGDVRPDLIHLHTSHAHTLGTVAARLAGRPAVVVSRRVDFSIFRHSFLGLNRLKYRMGLDRIVCVSDAVKNVLLADGLDADTLSVVRDAVDPARVRGAKPVDVRARLGLPARARIVLAIGALVGHKGHRHLIEAMPKLVAAVPDVHVVIAGGGPLRGELESLAKALWISQRLSMPGYIDDVLGWLPSAEVLCMPSVEEGLGSSILDAMAAGVPIVASRAGGIPEAVRDGVEGLLVKPGDPLGLADALLRLLNDPEERARMGAAGRIRVDEAFSVNRMVEETVALYEDVLRARGAESD